MKITICASMMFYEEVIKTKYELEALGHEVLVPEGALVMERDGNFDKEYYYQKYLGKNIDEGKAQAIKNHFDKIQQAEAILVVNNTKHGIDGYIGPNVLMEMGIAFHYDLIIFVLNSVSETSPFIEEIHAMSPIQINGDLNKLQKEIQS